MNKVIEFIVAAILLVRAKILMFFFKYCKIKNNTILVSNFWGKGYSENPAAVIDELLKRKKKNIKIYWIVDDINDKSLPKEIIKVKKRSIKYYYCIRTCKVWISNLRNRMEFSKRKGQFYIQIWHGSFPIKKVEKDCIDELDKTYVYAAKKDAKNTDLMVANSDFFIKLCRNSFWYDGRIEKYGTPKNDEIVNCKNHSKIVSNLKKEFGISSKEKIIMYAPTFRSGYGLDAYDIDFNLVLKEFEKKYKCNFKIFVRMHPNVGKININKLLTNKKIINVSSYSSMNHLLIACDVLITDYSSIMFDYGLMKKPVFLYASDMDKYDRGFYFDLKNLPFSFSQNNKELLCNIKDYNEKDYLKKINSFYDMIGLYENGIASKKVVDEILKVLGEKSEK